MSTSRVEDEDVEGSKTEGVTGPGLVDVAVVVAGVAVETDNAVLVLVGWARAEVVSVSSMTD